MKAAVWDTYVKKQDGNVIHFDVVVPDYITDSSVVYKYAGEYLISGNLSEVELNTKNCQFCHIESITDTIKNDIESKGFHIIEMEEIPSQLPHNPTRREMILYLRAHCENYRYADFREKSEEEIRQIIQKLINE
jgi:hypothetical protein